MDLERKVAQKLIQSGKTLAIAESCTGGLLSNRLTDTPGSSNYFKGALIVYSNESKTNLLKVPADTIRRHGAVSAEVAVKMAQNVRKVLKTDFGLAITGIAGPGGGTKLKPMGLTFIALSSDVGPLCVEYQFTGNRKNIKTLAAKRALGILLKCLLR